MVERYFPSGFEQGMREFDNGAWVRHSDYAELAAENARLRKSLSDQIDRDISGIFPAEAALSRTGAVKVDELAQEIRRVDGSNSLGAGALAEALLPFLSALSPAAPEGEQGAETPSERQRRLCDHSVSRAEGHHYCATCGLPTYAALKAELEQVKRERDTWRERVSINIDQQRSAARKALAALTKEPGQ